MYADDAVRLLRNHRRRGQSLRDGFPQWRDSNVPVSEEVPS